MTITTLGFIFIVISVFADNVGLAALGIVCCFAGV